MLPVVYHPIYSCLELPENHRYPINKYRLLYQAAIKRWPNMDWKTPKPLNIDQVKTVHDPSYIDALFSGQLPGAKMRRIGFPWSEALIERTLTSAAGTVLAVQCAIEQGVGLHLSGGYHHAHRDLGMGFCLINDLVIAADEALKHPNVDKVLIVDADVHQGDGSATLCQERDDIITLSLHSEKNFPARKPDSDIDIALPNGCDDVQYLDNFQSVVALAVSLHQPDVILYDAGVDVHCDDELGYLNLSTSGLYSRDHWLFSHAKQKEIPIAAVIGGGYRRNEEQLVELHMQLIKAALAVFSPT
ncbi:histone deacetylase [Vibrio sp. SCSIO 43136]|uniref:histone deacetylase family protein n=1 Tax=Vibrio sp. SCSIO 43136 TaxID=2819101 RepID=UPI002075C5FB|nr:histone deacetylase [Vibrio sp. SCSIO 43136]USD66631.1 histone deacetylase [Vibrio sp. SCSIO 43136]